MEKGYGLWIQSVLEVAFDASKAILDIYTAKNYQIKTKLDDSPVTEADLKAHQIIKSGLNKIDPRIPLLSEEGEDIPFSLRSTWSRYWLVDPLDGTKEFIRGTGEFTINIALIENHVPVLGVVLAPVLQHCYWAVKGDAAYFQDLSSSESSSPKLIHVQNKISFPIRIALSRHHTKEENSILPFLKHLENTEIIYCGSALKICLVASGTVDLYPRFGPTGEWDTAAGQCILETAGGQLVDFEGRPFRYNTRESLVNPGFLAVGNVELLPYIVDKS